MQYKTSTNQKRNSQKSIQTNGLQGEEEQTFSRQRAAPGTSNAKSFSGKYSLQTLTQEFGNLGLRFGTGRKIERHLRKWRSMVEDREQKKRSSLQKLGVVITNDGVVKSSGPNQGNPTVVTNSFIIDPPEVEADNLEILTTEEISTVETTTDTLKAEADSLEILTVEEPGTVETTTDIPKAEADSLEILTVEEPGTDGATTDIPEAEADSLETQTAEETNDAGEATLNTPEPEADNPETQTTNNDESIADMPEAGTDHTHHDTDSQTAEGTNGDSTMDDMPDADGGMNHSHDHDMGSEMSDMDSGTNESMADIPEAGTDHTHHATDGQTAEGTNGDSAMDDMPDADGGMNHSHDHDMGSEMSDMDGSHDMHDMPCTESSHDHGSHDHSMHSHADHAAIADDIHPDDLLKHGEHMSLLDLLPHGEETFTAVNNGSWFDPHTWANCEVPHDGAKVLITQGVSVLYDQESDIRLDTVRIDGTLTFAHDQNTKMIVDTLFSDVSGSLIIGTEENPIQADKTTQIIIDSQDAVSDAAQMGKGVITHGVTRIFGAEKLDFVSLQNASAGDNKLFLNLPDGATSPEGWQVGDRLVLGGTAYNPNGSDEDNSRFQDEVLIITAIDGNEISFINTDITEGDNTVLRFDHARPEGFEDQTNIYIANTSRNVIFATENGKDAPLLNRGHVMFMHNPDVQVVNAGFYELGRTNKNELVDDIGTNRDVSVGNGTNVRGRYSLHFHRTGVDDINGTPSLAKGNAVVGSPGWGIVHHDSHTILEDNVVFDVLGAGISAESGNEIGRWSNNITIKTTGDDDPSEGFDHKEAPVQRFDFGRNGEGFWVQGAAQVSMIDNVAVSANAAGLTIFGGADGGVQPRDVSTIAVANLPESIQDLTQGVTNGDVVDLSAIPIGVFTGFEAYNTHKGITTWGSMLNSDGQLSLDVPGSDTIDTVIPTHDYRSTIDDFTLWNVRNNGVQLWYSTQFDLSNGLVLADKSIHPFGRGVGVANNFKNHTSTNLHVEGFAIGMQLPNDHGGNAGEGLHRDFIGSVIKDSYISGVRTNFGYFDNDGHYLRLEGNNTFGQEATNDNASPIASFTTSVVGGLAYHFDGAASLDSDPWNSHEKYETNGIIAYGWDFESNGIIDAFGRQIDHYFEATGVHNVSLTVWDQMGQATTQTQVVDVQQHAYGNAFFNGDFSEDSFLNYASGSSIYANSGWGAAGSGLHLSPEGALVFSDGDDWSGALGQVLQDNYIRRGIHTLGLDIVNLNGSSDIYHANDISLKVWGVNGQFENRIAGPDGPKQAGAIDMESVQLLDVDLGDDSYDWQHRTWDLDLGHGYQFLLLEMHVKNTHHAGDYVAVDNVSLTGDGAIVLGAIPDSLATGLPTTETDNGSSPLVDTTSGIA